MNYLKIAQKLNRFLIQHIKGSHFILPIINNYFLPKVEGEVEIKTIYDFIISVNPNVDEAIEKAIYERGVYEHGTLHIIDSFLREGDTFIDVGANIGLMTLLAAKKVKKQGAVYAFEVNPMIFHELERNLKKNELLFVKTYSCALGAHRGKGTLFENEFEKNRGGSTMLEVAGNENRKYEVKVTTLDEMFVTTDINLIKIDVEGWELNVLNGGNQFFSRKNAPAIIIECSNDRVNDIDDRENIYNKIKSLNDYRIFKLKNKEKGDLLKFM